tara:strand:+ start:182 stop:988 length:807 start_codon:yes stop_codon:yes gene_type:complete
MNKNLCFSYLNKYISLLFIFLTHIINSQIEYNWQNSQEGWVSASETNNGCQLFAQPEALAMRAFNATPIMRSGNLQADLGIDASTYNQVEIILKNPIAIGVNANPNAILFAYPPGSNEKICSWRFPVDTGMTEFSTYIIDLESEPDNGDIFEGPVARFGLRAPWGIANLDTVYWKKMTILNTNTIGTLENEVSLNTFPNPVSDNLLIEANEPIENIEIKDLTGRIVLEMKPHKSKIQIETAELTNDLYFLNCFVNKKWVTKKIILTKL